MWSLTMPANYFIYRPGELSIVSYADTEENATTQLPRLNGEYGPGLVVVPADEFMARRKQQLIGNAKLEEIDKEAWMRCLEVLPPEDWHTDEDGVNKFLMSEYYTGTFTTQYAKYKKRYFSRMVDASDRSTFITRQQIEDFTKGA